MMSIVEVFAGRDRRKRLGYRMVLNPGERPMVEAKADLLEGALDVQILKTRRLAPLHGRRIAKRMPEAA